MKRITMRDVAIQAGVSKSTVSHVINETRFVEETTRQRVLDAISELNYRPDRVARSLVFSRTYSVGLLISDVSNPFYHQVIRGVEDVALAHDYNVFLFNANYDLARSLKYIHSMIDRHADGVMMMSSRLSADLVVELTAHQVPVVLLDWEEVPVDDASTITIDFAAGIREVVGHLVELGHRRFAHVSGPLDLWTSRTRRDAFLSALAERDIDPAQVPVIEGNLRSDGGRNALHAILQLDPRPTAVFAANDLTAYGLIWEARKQGLRLPGDLSVAGVDDIDLSAQITPTLTTVALPSYEIGKLAMSMLLGRINPNIPELECREQHCTVSTRLIVRESTGSPNGVAH